VETVQPWLSPVPADLPLVVAVLNLRRIQQAIGRADYEAAVWQQDAEAWTNRPG
jgi:hypothetical protein